MQREQLPDWLATHRPGERPSLRQFFRSRVVIYPGSGFDGSPVRLFGSRHLAHCFVYADYAVTRPELTTQLSEGGFRGYRTLDRIALREEDLVTGTVHYHVTADELLDLGQSAIRQMQPQGTPFGFLEILERKPPLDDAHGPARLAILFLYADGYAAFDALFCQTDGSAPYAVVLEDHGFGRCYSTYGNDGLLHRIARRSDRYPQYLWCAVDGTEPWPEYAPVPGFPIEMGGVHGTRRTLLERQPRR